VGPRIRRLRERLLGSGGCTPEWTLLMYESLRRTEEQPIVARRAAAFAHLLDNLPIAIDEGELLVGRFLKREPTSRERDRLSEAERYMARPELSLYAAPEYAELSGYAEHGIFTVRPIYLHIAPDVERLLKLGWSGIRQLVEERLEDGGLDEGQRTFLRAVLLTVGAASRFILRYADLAEATRPNAADARRRRELGAIADACRRLAAGPACTFHEAVQLAWFQYFMMNAELGPIFNSSGPAHLDCYLLPFYRRDLEQERISRAEAAELIQHLFLSMNVPNRREGILPAIVGGLDADGADASNELTELCLEAVEALGLLHPSIALRCHRDMPRPLLRKAVGMWKGGGGYPQLFNDEVVIPSLCSSGVSEEDAAAWIHSVCTEVTAIGTTNAWIASPYFNMAKPLELVINNGRSLLTRRQIGEDRGELSDYGDFQSLLAAYHDEMAHWIGVVVVLHNRIEELFKATRPQPFLSASIRDCIARGRDYTDGGPRYNPNYIQATGISTTTDSLALLRDLVFEEGRVPASELLDALRRNFEGHPRLRALLTHHPRKYGNDLPEVDGLFVQLAKSFYSEVRKHANTRGGRYHPGFMVFTSHEELGELTGATPDGRLARTALSDSVGAVQGMDRSGLTALLRSVTRTDFVPAVGGVTFNVRLMPYMFESEDVLEKLVDAVRTYFALGGFQIQANVVDSEVLRDAQACPERHGALMVRVGGFSAYFTELVPGIQDEIIRRTEHGGR
jgi:formate C-acetyltransferase